jgi:hypothetical protein
MSADYHFVTRWRVAGTCGEVSDILADPLDLTRWWPSVYLNAVQLEPPGAGGVGRRVRLVTKGWLPYTLTWEFVVSGSRYPYGSTIDVSGDFTGRGVWTLSQDGNFADITYDWRVRADKPLIRSLSFLLRPVFEANHRWAMAQGEESLALELARRRAPTREAAASIPAPPGPVTLSAVGLLAGGVLTAAAGACLIVRLGRRLRRSA